MYWVSFVSSITVLGGCYIVPPIFLFLFFSFSFSFSFYHQDEIFNTPHVIYLFSFAKVSASKPNTPFTHPLFFVFMRWNIQILNPTYLTKKQIKPHIKKKTFFYLLQPVIRLSCKFQHCFPASFTMKFILR